MDSEQILNHYKWSLGVCFRHPSKGEIQTVVVRTLHPRTNGDYPVRACPVCVLAIEAAREEATRASGGEYVPGHAGDALS